MFWIFRISTNQLDISVMPLHALHCRPKPYMTSTIEEQTGLVSGLKA
jgi:hypothetical protein